jgi:cobalamin-dependent methionine synthase I
MISLGCAKNLVDAEIMLGSVIKEGMEITSNADEADVLIVNTCAFIDSAKEESIEAIRLIRQEFPRVNAILGLSNVSFGLKPAARQVLNSVFLEEARRAGLNAAIVHYSKLVPESRVGSEIWKIGEDLVFDRRKFALA